jgi:uncharacterized protein (DUF488 family)
MKIFTIGHSNHSIESFVDLLKKHSISAIADVRSHPYSRHFPHFSQSSFKQVLKSEDIAYAPLCDYLGARPNEQSCYVEGMARYELIATTEAFSVGLNRIIHGAKQHKIALMCAEQDPIVCHRAILVCQYLKNTELNIQHILKTGDLESHNSLERRLLKLHHLDKYLPQSEKIDNEPKSVEQLLLFDTNTYNNSSTQLDITGKYPSLAEEYNYDTLVQKAYQLQGERIAYVVKTDTELDEFNGQAD